MKIFKIKRKPIDWLEIMQEMSETEVSARNRVPHKYSEKKHA